MKTGIGILTFLVLILFQHSIAEASGVKPPHKVVVGTILSVDQSNQSYKVTLSLKDIEKKQIVQFSPAKLKNGSLLNLSLLKSGAMLKAFGSRETRSIPSILLADQVWLYQKVKIKQKIATQAEIDRCKELGGVMRKGGLRSLDYCSQQLSDAGHACSDQSECFAKCFANEDVSKLKSRNDIVGICEATDDIYGCKDLIENGRYFLTRCYE